MKNHSAAQKRKKKKKKKRVQVINGYVCTYLPRSSRLLAPPPRGPQLQIVWLSLPWPRPPPSVGFSCPLLWVRRRHASLMSLPHTVWRLLTLRRCTASCVRQEMSSEQAWSFNIWSARIVFFFFFFFSFLRCMHQSTSTASKVLWTC